MENTKELRAIYKVQAHINPEEYANLEKYCAEKNEGISSVVRGFIKEAIANAKQARIG